ncbi:Hsp20/alpha crystallin family protein [Dyella choica]|uniref:Hsp20/alpha crystallin family protein n=1 Tax=Dyella choica TaxID=1927959 RepID=A0A3S0RN63_9GAMM|nr:Hsp20/alpha crystallin family protein [Dyella choica]RUL79732.1 Hsp20/alpha crystallin family protein [Dyella choica]
MNVSRSHLWSASRAFPADVRHRFERYFQGEESDGSSVVTSQWAPRVDIKEEEQRFVIYADIPGVDPANIEVSMEKGILAIKGERAVEKQDQSGRFTRVERAHGSFHRRFALPDSADADNISATGKHGVLEIVIPKKAEKAPRRITISTQ